VIDRKNYKNLGKVLTIISMKRILFSRFYLFDPYGFASGFPITPIGFTYTLLYSTQKQVAGVPVGELHVTPTNRDVHEKLSQRIDRGIIEELIRDVWKAPR